LGLAPQRDPMIAGLAAQQVPTELGPLANST